MITGSFPVMVALSFKTAWAIWHPVTRLEFRRRRLAVFDAQKPYSVIAKVSLSV